MQRVIIFIFLFFLVSNSFAQVDKFKNESSEYDSDFELPETESKSKKKDTNISEASDSKGLINEKNPSKLSILGNIEGGFNLIGLNKSSLFYKTRFYNNTGVSSPLDLYRLRLEANADYKYDKIGFHIKTRTTYVSQNDSNIMLNEAYNYILFTPNIVLSSGKKIFKWGVGYIYNPVGFLNPLKDIDYPERDNEGKLSISLDLIKTFSSQTLRNISFTAVVIPLNESINNQMGQAKNINVAGKFSVLILDSDIDLMGFYGKSVPGKVGMAFSRSFLNNFVLNLEFAYTFRENLREMNSNSIPNNYNKNVYSFLAGIRYQKSTQFLLILEYFHNGSGNKRDIYKNYLNFLNSNYNNYLNTGDPTFIQPYNTTMNTYNQGRTFFLRDYVYLKMSSQDFLDVVYLNPYISGLFNVNDYGVYVMPGIMYAPYTNIEFNLLTQFLFGKDDSEYGSKPNKWMLEFTIKVYFKS